MRDSIRVCTPIAAEPSRQIVPRTPIEFEPVGVDPKIPAFQSSGGRHNLYVVHMKAPLENEPVPERTEYRSHSAI